MSTFFQSSLLTTKEFSRDHVLELIEKAEHFLPAVVERKMLKVLDDKILGALFYEPSTRTRISFESAMHRLGGRVISVVGMENSSLLKGETLADTAKLVENCVDVVAMRHPTVGSVAEFARSASVPVFNAGDGAGEHPTQALLDMFTLVQEKGKIDGLHLVLCGDLKYGRTVHSLSYLLANFKLKLTLVSPPQLQMPDDVIQDLRSRGVDVEVSEQLEPFLKDADVVYSTRVQKERFADVQEYESLKAAYVLHRDVLEKHNPEITVMHPFPRVVEIDTSVDDMAGAAYFRQMRNGVAVRMALLSMVFGR